MTEPATEPDQVEEEVDEPRSSLVWVWATGVVLIGVLVYVFLFDLLALGDGAVGAQSDTLSMGQEAGAEGTPVDLVGREPGGIMTIAFPIKNRGLVPVTIISIDPPTTTSPCPWRRSAVAGTREDAASVADIGGGMDPFKVSGGGTVQVYVGATFPEDSCDAEAVEESTIGNLVVEYRVMGFIPRRQELPMGTAITTTGDPDDPRLEEPPETLDLDADS